MAVGSSSLVQGSVFLKWGCYYFFYQVMFKTTVAQPRTASFYQQVEIIWSSAHWLMEGTKGLSK